jgi:hypothetical protein
MRYAGFAYITPPRAEVKSPRSLLSSYQEKGWWAQIKKNGTNSMIFVGPDRLPFAYNRHGERHKQWAFTAASAAPFAALPGTGWYVLNAELLHSKVRGGPKDTNYVHDVLVADGVYLLGKSYAERYAMVRGLFVPGPNLLVAEYVSEGFGALFDSLSAGEDEGLVLKNPAGKLGTRDGSGAGWMVKCRRIHKNFGF